MGWTNRLTTTESIRFAGSLNETQMAFVEEPHSGYQANRSNGEFSHLCERADRLHLRARSISSDVPANLAVDLVRSTKSCSACGTRDRIAASCDATVAVSPRATGPVSAPAGPRSNAFAMIASINGCAASKGTPAASNSASDRSRVVRV